jgi:hypothetical protein
MQLQVPDSGTACVCFTACCPAAAAAACGCSERCAALSKVLRVLPLPLVSHIASAPSTISGCVMHSMFMPAHAGCRIDGAQN